MTRAVELFDRIDRPVAAWMRITHPVARHGITFLRVSPGNNLVLVSAGLVIGATVRGGRVVAKPIAAAAGAAT